MNKPSTYGRFILWWALLLAIGLFFLGFFIFKGNMWNSPYGMSNTISVMGEGKAMVKPDMLVINLSISELADSTEQAQEQSNKKTTQITDMLRSLNISETSLKTTNYNVSPEYDRSQPQGRKLLGYRVWHSMSLTLSGDNFTQLWGKVLDGVAKIGGINIDNTFFDLKDKNTALAAAREQALQDARAKAEQLAKASWAKLGKVVTITDNTYYNFPGPVYRAYDAWGIGASEQSTPSLSPGETEVTVNVNVTYKLK